MTYDIIELTGWRIGTTTTVPREADFPLLDGLPDNVTALGHQELTLTVVPEGFNGSTILSPADADQRRRVDAG